MQRPPIDRTRRLTDYSDCGCDQAPAVVRGLAQRDPSRVISTGPPRPTMATDTLPVPAEPDAEIEGVAAGPRIGWHGPLVIEGQVTGDGRLIEAEALRWETPLPFRSVLSDVGGHDGAVTVGVIETITRQAGGALEGTGWLDLGSEAGREAARQVEQGLGQGVSVDLDDVSWEERAAASVIAELDDRREGGEESDPPERGTDADGRVIVSEGTAGDWLTVTTSARVRAATLVAIPAFADAKIVLDGPLADVLPADAPTDDTAPALAASASPVPDAPPAEWFADPRLTGPTALTVTDEGRVFGHLAAWGTCHTGFRNECVTAPRSASSYAHFHLGSLRTAEGHDLAVGRITMDTGHAGLELAATPTLAHYDDTGTVVADIRAGEDEHGIWVAGALRPGLAAAQLRRLRAAPLSGDWRGIGGSLELVAALAVNSPGYPVPRPAGMVASGRQVTLVASSGALGLGGAAPLATSPTPASPGTLPGLSDADLREMRRLASRERRSRVDRMRRSLQAQQLRSRINSWSASPSADTPTLTEPSIKEN